MRSSWISHRNSIIIPNSYIYLYGNMDMERSRFIDEKYLSAFDALDGFCD